MSLILRVCSIEDFEQALKIYLVKMSEKPGAKTPWGDINQLLAPQERFEISFSHWKGWLLIPTSSSQLAALLYLLSQAEILFCIQGRGSSFFPSQKQNVIVSARALTQIVWHAHGIVEAGAGCSLRDLQQFLLERNREICLEEDAWIENKRSIASLILLGLEHVRTIKPFSEMIMGVDFVTFEGSQIKWGGHYLSPTAGLALHKLMEGLKTLPAVISKVIMRTELIPEIRLKLTWNFNTKDALWNLFQALQSISSTWESLEIVHSGRSDESGFVFAQISGVAQEINAFIKICPHYSQATQDGQRQNLKKYFSQENMHFNKIFFNQISDLKSYKVEPGEYLWIENNPQRAWLLSLNKFAEREEEYPLWKKILCESFTHG